MKYKLNEELTLIEKKKKYKKPYDSMYFTTGDIQYNIDQFNKHAGSYLNGTIDGQSVSQSNDFSAAESSGGEGSGEGCCENLQLTEQQMYVSKWNEFVDIPDHLHILNRRDIEKAIESLEPEEEFEVGYVTPITFYSELDSLFSLVKCTQFVGYTGIDYIEARADDPQNRDARIKIAKDTAALGTDNGIHFDRRPHANKQGDFSAQYSQTNKTVKQHFDNKHSGLDKDNQFIAVDGEGRNYETILFYPKLGSSPKVTYYIDMLSGRGFHKVNRDQLENVILTKVAENADELRTGLKKDGTPRTRRWGDADLAKKIEKQLAQDAATISAVSFNKENQTETRSKISNGNIDKPQVRALYTNQIYYLKTSSVTLGNALNEELELDEAKRYVRRYYIRPLNKFASNKDEIVKWLLAADEQGQNCSVYTLLNLGDTKDVTKLTNKDIIYYYDDGILYDKNHVKVMDYDLFVKHEEKRDIIDPDKVSDSTFKDVYDDRITDQTGLDEAFNLEFNDINAYNETLVEGKVIDDICCICGEKIEGYGNNPYPVKDDGRCCDACNMKFVIPARLDSINNKR